MARPKGRAQWNFLVVLTWTPQGRRNLLDLRNAAMFEKVCSVQSGRPFQVSLASDQRRRAALAFVLSYRKRLVRLGWLNSVALAGRWSPLGAAVVLVSCGHDRDHSEPDICVTKRELDAGETYTSADVPKGDCNPVGHVCALDTQDQCSGGGIGPTLKWTCTCEMGGWSCNDESTSLTVCLP
jgi:hypothetical protein